MIPTSATEDAGWAEFNAAAAWCAERGSSCTILPAGLSVQAHNLISKYRNTFRDRVREFVAARVGAR